MLLGLEIGSWAEWLAAILTGGSLLLGFYILLQDRRKAERAQAARVAMSRDMTVSLDSPEVGSIEIHVANHSDLPIYVVKAKNLDLPGVAAHFIEPVSQREGSFDTIHPGAYGKFVTEYVPIEMGLVGDWIVIFRDAVGVEWVCSVGYHLLFKYRRQRDGIRIMQRRTISQDELNE